MKNILLCLLITTLPAAQPPYKNFFKQKKLNTTLIETVKEAVRLCEFNKEHIYSAEWFRIAEYPKAIQKVKDIIHLGADINYIDPHNTYPLRLALPDPNLVEILVKKGADVNKSTSKSPLYKAMELILQSPCQPKKVAQIYKTISILVSYGAVINQQDDRGQTPFMHFVLNVCWAHVNNALHVLELLQAKKMLLCKKISAESAFTYFQLLPPDLRNDVISIYSMHVDLTLKNKAGNTALDLAQINEQKKAGYRGDLKGFGPLLTALTTISTASAQKKEPNMPDNNVLK